MLIRILDWVCRIATVAGLVVLFIQDGYKALFALAVFCAILLALLVVCVVFVYKQLNRASEDGFIVNSHFVKYETQEDGAHIKYEVYRHIQCKRMILSEFDWKFKWTGSKLPIITSKCQRKGNRIKTGGSGEYDAVRLYLKSPILYNQTALVHFHAEMDDFDHASLPFVETRVKIPLEVLHWRVVLKNKPSDYTKPALVKKKKIGTEVEVPYEIIESVPFDRLSKSYEYHFIKPEVGYDYRIEFER